MAFWEELGKTITDKGKEATKKAKELTETIQLKSQISAEKTKIEEAYASIGKLYYDDHKDNPDDRYAEGFNWVKESLDKVAGLEEELSQLEGSRVCAECGCKVAKEDAFCRRCGAPMAQAKDTCEEEVCEDTVNEAAEEDMAAEAVPESEEVVETPNTEVVEGTTEDFQ